MCVWQHNCCCRNWKHRSCFQRIRNANFVPQRFRWRVVDYISFCFCSFDFNFLLSGFFNLVIFLCAIGFGMERKVASAQVISEVHILQNLVQHLLRTQMKTVWCWQKAQITHLSPRLHTTTSIKWVINETVTVIFQHRLHLYIPSHNIHICMGTTCIWTFHIHIITMIKLSLSHHQPPLRVQRLPIDFHHAWIENIFCNKMFYTWFFVFCQIVCYNDLTLTSFCIESYQILNVTLNLNSAVFWSQTTWFMKEPFSRALRRFANATTIFHKLITSTSTTTI